MTILSLFRLMARMNTNRKREVDAKYRQKQRTQNAEEYAAHRREISKQSYYKKKESESVRDKRHRLRKEREKKRMYRAKKKALLVQEDNQPLSSPLLLS
jgi:hypothetical protein